MGYLGERRIGKGQRESLLGKVTESFPQLLSGKSWFFFVSLLHTQLQILQLLARLVGQSPIVLTPIVLTKPGSHYQKRYSHISIGLTTFATIFSCIIGNIKISVGAEKICHHKDTVNNAHSLCFLSSHPLASTQLIKSNELTSNILVYFCQKNITFDRYTSKNSFGIEADLVSVRSVSDLQKINFLSCENEEVSCFRNSTYLPLEISQANPQQNVTPTTSQPSDPPPLEGQPNLPTSSPTDNSPLTPPQMLQRIKLRDSAEACENRNSSRIKKRVREN